MGSGRSEAVEGEAWGAGSLRRAHNCMLEQASVMRISILGRIRRWASQEGVSQAGLAGWWIGFTRGNDQVCSSTAAPKWPGGINGNVDVDQESYQTESGSRSLSRTLHLRQCLVPTALDSHTFRQKRCVFVCKCVCVSVCAPVCANLYPKLPQSPTSTSREY